MLYNLLVYNGFSEWNGGRYRGDAGCEMEDKVLLFFYIMDFMFFVLLCLNI